MMTQQRLNPPIVFLCIALCGSFAGPTFAASPHELVSDSALRVAGVRWDLLTSFEATPFAPYVYGQPANGGNQPRGVVTSVFAHHVTAFAESVAQSTVAAVDSPVAEGQPSGEHPVAADSIQRALNESGPRIHAGGPVVDLHRPQDFELADRPYWRRNMFKRLYKDQIFLLTEWWPAEIRNPFFSAPLVASLAAGSSGGGQVDIAVEDFVYDNITPLAEGSFRSMTDLGDVYLVAGVGVAYAISPWVDNTTWKRASSLSTEALLNTAIWSSLIKQASGRFRPGQGYRAQFFQYSAEPGVSTNSFPSGHTMAAFSVAAVMADVVGYRRWIKWVVYGTAGMVGLSRIALRRHYVSDVVAGAMIGRSLGKMVTSRDSTDRQDRRLRRSWSPLVDPSRKAYGMQWSLSWD